MHVIRAWEKRYHAVTPQRTDTDRRLYCESDVQRLILLKHLVERGFSIGQIAMLSDQQLKEAFDDTKQDLLDILPTPMESAPHAVIAECMLAIENYDSEQLRTILMRAMLDMSDLMLIHEIVVPLMHRIGVLWQSGEIRIAQEHLASAVVRDLLGSLISRQPSYPGSHVMISTTLPGYEHEVGSMVVAISAASQGWRSIYLGSGLPPEEIAAAAARLNADVIAISLAFPDFNPRTSDELVRLARYLNSSAELIVGGTCSDSYRPILSKIGAIHLGDLNALVRYLQAFRDSSRLPNEA